MDVLLPPKWTCSDNVWDLSRCDICLAVSLFPRFIGFVYKYNPYDLRRLYDTFNLVLQGVHVPHQKRSAQRNRRIF